MRSAILDIGSNSAHLKIVDLRPGEPIRDVRSVKRPTRLAESITLDGRLGPAAAGRLGAAVSGALAVARDEGAEELVAFATSALRDAVNREEIVAGLAARTGVEPAFLSGEDEARLTFLAARGWYGWSAGPLLLADIGGGSLEIAAGDGAEPAFAMSLPLGAGRLTRDHLPGDPPGRSDTRALRRFVRDRLAECLPAEPLAGPARPIATSKIFTQLARLNRRRNAAGDRILRRKDLRARIPKLAAMTADERADLKGVSPSRARQILAGAVVAEEVMRHLGLKRLEICPWALREGIALRRIQHLDGLSRHSDDIDHLLRPMPDRRARLRAVGESVS
ncbi:Ppx/GppA phosphatase family protein [Spirillospora sp. NPDC029432]|uniref:Ppx/GppA phosphatase family protein n=1 Tax=Spirillospora sp. NPDC029432 TaxID=3154599 RepID=UPI0034561AED